MDRSTIAPDRYLGDYGLQTESTQDIKHLAISLIFSLNLQSTQAELCCWCCCVVGYLDT